MAAGSKSRYLFEIVGTFIFVFAICSVATVYSGSNKLLGIVGLPPLAMAVLGLVHAFVLTSLILAAGITFLINTASELSILYLTGVSLLIASIIFVFLILNHKRLIMGINPKYVKYQLNDPKDYIR